MVRPPPEPETPPGEKPYYERWAEAADDDCPLCNGKGQYFSKRLAPGRLVKCCCVDRGQ